MVMKIEYRVKGLRIRFSHPWQPDSKSFFRYCTSDENKLIYPIIVEYLSSGISDEETMIGILEAAKQSIQQSQSQAV